MAYDRYDTRNDGSRWSDERDRNSNWGRGNGTGRRDDDRGFFERAGDEIASWFGDDDAERRRRQDRGRDDRERGSGYSRSDEHRGSSDGQDRDYDRGYGRDYQRDRQSYMRHERDHDRDQQRDQNRNRGTFSRGGSSESDYNRDWRDEYSSDRNRERGRDYRPMAGDYGRSDHESDQFFAASGVGRNDYGRKDFGHSDNRSQSEWARDPYRSSSRAGSADSSDRSRHDDHYRSWRDRHMSDLDRDYDDYRREHQSKFENDFGSWREKRQQKRGLLGEIHEHMEVVGKDGEHVGTVDKTAGDRIILTKSDPDSGGVHHSLSCSDVDCVKDGKVVLDCSAKDAKQRWRDESRSRALFERDDQGEMGPRNLNRSFEGTYR